MTKHNFALASRLDVLQKTKCRTIFHFDTHADMNLFMIMINY